MHEPLANDEALEVSLRLLTPLVITEQVGRPPPRRRQRETKHPPSPPDRTSTTDSDTQLPARSNGQIRNNVEADIGSLGLADAGQSQLGRQQDVFYDDGEAG